jgi:YNFM family putative membrane transporter
VHDKLPRHRRERGGGDAPHVELGSPQFRAVARALFAVGLASFALLYCVQPLQPQFSRAFGVSAAESSLSLSLTTGAIALMLLVASTLSDALGRKRVLVWSIFASVLLTALAAAAPDWTTLLWLRLLVGVTLSGVQAVAMAYVGEEVEPRAIGYATGLLISGISIGGLAGRLVAGLLNDIGSWRLALGVIAAIALVAGVYVWRALPESRHFRPVAPQLRVVVTTLRGHLGSPALRSFYAIAFLSMGGFVATYSLLGFRLLAPPYELSQAVVSAIFLFYLAGAAVSTWAGRLSDSVGHRVVILASLAVALAGIGITLAQSLWLVVLGLGIFTAGFFGVHAAASGAVSRLATQGRAQASALYLCAFYLGSSVLGSAVALLWPSWPAIVSAVAALLVVAVAIALASGRATSRPPT